MLRTIQTPRVLSTLALLATLSSPALAIDWTLCPGIDQPSQANSTEPRYEGFFSPYTHHWSHDEEHKPVFAVSVSRLLPNDRRCGISLFRNSFGQPSAYAFVGKSWPGILSSYPNVYASVTAGIMYGYVGKYKNKVPANVGGFSPAIIPAIGYQLSPRSSLEIQILGTAAFMVGTNWRF
ncbi:hypothetical protein [Hydrogenophaga sp.]|uniref:hypothetical protein n=1 Tax=Hydrogenophaga sp. TaxID=1904254 RepID=UPI002729393F|nr:hypothetical protein [Hydrogenophaga sp.]MDO9439033.1 hypothetical protein [Hydrogenophaga sp.]